MSLSGSLRLNITIENNPIITDRIQTVLFGHRTLLNNAFNTNYVIENIHPGSYNLTFPTFQFNKHIYRPVANSYFITIEPKQLTPLQIVYTVLPVAEDPDSDGDGIPDDVEKSGYWFNGTDIIPIDPDNPIDPDITTYRSDYSLFSTTNDPYNDYMKVTGKQMDLTVTDQAERQPLVAAFPHVEVRITGITVTPKAVITDKYGGKKSEAITRTDGVTETTTITKGWNIGGKLAGKLVLKPGGKSPGEISGEITGGYSESIAEATATSWSIATASTDEFNWESATTIDTTQAAELSLAITMKNVGTATIIEPTPAINVYLGDVLLKTLTKDLLNIPINLSLEPGEEVTISAKPEVKLAFWLTLDQLKAYQLGTPLNFEIIEVDGKCTQPDGSGGWIPGVSWNLQLNAIKQTTATIAFEDNFKSPQATSYNRVAAKRTLGNWDPEMTLAEAILLTIPNSTDLEGGGISIGGNRVDERWAFYIRNDDTRYYPEPDSRLNEIMSQLNDPSANPEEGILQIQLKAQDYVYIKSPTSNPTPLITFAQYDPSYQIITAAVTVGAYPIKNVDAVIQLSRSNGSTTIPLRYNFNTGLWDNSHDPVSPEIDGNYSEARVIAYDKYIDKNGEDKPNTSQLSISPASYFEGGLSYIPKLLDPIPQAIGSGSTNVPINPQSAISVFSLETMGSSSQDSFVVLEHSTNSNYQNIIPLNSNDRRMMDGEYQYYNNASGGPSGSPSPWIGESVWNRSISNDAGRDQAAKIEITKLGNDTTNLKKLFRITGYDSDGMEGVYQLSDTNTLSTNGNKFNASILTYTGGLSTIPATKDVTIILRRRSNDGTSGQEVRFTFSKGTQHKNFSSTIYSFYANEVEIVRGTSTDAFFIELFGDAGGSSTNTQYYPLYFGGNRSIIQLETEKGEGGNPMQRPVTISVRCVKQGYLYELGAPYTKPNDTSSGGSPFFSRIGFATHLPTNSELLPNQVTQLEWSFNNYINRSRKDTPLKFNIQPLGYFKPYQFLSSTVDLVLTKLELLSNSPTIISPTTGINISPPNKKIGAAYLVEVINDSNPYLELTLNGVNCYLGTGDKSLIKEDYKPYQGVTRSELLFLPDEKPTQPTGIIKGPAKNFTNGSVKINILGVFKEQFEPTAPSGLLYKVLENPIKIHENGAHSLTETVNSKPKAYVLQARIKGHYARNTILTMTQGAQQNKEVMHLGISDMYPNALNEIQKGVTVDTTEYGGHGIFIPDSTNPFAPMPWNLKNLATPLPTDKEVYILGYFA